ncbi:response regulator [Deinococcus sp. KNUC1210]|uniref:response regulator n=1 Tax=Deinococcus sp. KNUC1210 TaxID=2917691 RepID=UPI001EEFD0BB|nr:response regulator [Deinococcus sp. KNUC1210]ULH16603.1 response regulator [Deinococcus sp. KNUC1210]
MTRPAVPATRPCILLVEDDASIREYLELGFGYEGFQVLHAANGSDALALFERERPGVVVLDVGLPGLDGFAVLRAIRERSATPVLMLTARDGVEDRIQGLKEGAERLSGQALSFRRAGGAGSGGSAAHPARQRARPDLRRPELRHAAA